MGKTLTAATDVAARGMRVATLRAVDYLRVSTEEQAEGFGIAYSGKRTVKYIERKGWSHVGTYADEGLSGSLEAEDRPDLKRLMSDALKTPRPFDMVVVNEGRVIGRTGRAFWRWVWELEDIGVYVAVVKKDYDNSTAQGRSQMRKDADYAEEERELIRERTQGGIQEKAEEGGYVGGVVPFGWEVQDRGKKGLSRYAVCEAEAETLRQARQLYLTHRSWTAVALLLNSEKRFTKTGKPWTHKNIRSRMLGDAVLNNRIIWRGKQAARRPDGTLVFGEQVTIALPPVFSDEEIKELKDAAAAEPRTAPKNGRVYTLTGHMISPCGETYRGHNQHAGYYVYRCRGREEAYAGSGGTCSCPPLDAPLLEATVWNDLRAVLGDADRMKAMAQDWIGSVKAEHVDHVGRIASLDQQIAEQRQTINVTMAVSARQAIQRGMTEVEAEESVMQALKPLNENLEELEKLRREALAWQRDASEAEGRARNFERLAEAARSDMTRMDSREQAELFAALDLRAVVVHCVKKRLGVACAVTTWFHDHDRLVPTLTDEAWQRVEPLLRGRRSDTTYDRRAILEALLMKARTGVRYKELPAEYGKPDTLQTTANRWLKRGVWDQVMELLKNEPGEPAWSPDPVQVEVSIRPLATECRPGDEDSSPWVTRPGSSLTLTFATAA